MKKQLHLLLTKTILIVLIIFLSGSKLFSQQVVLTAKTYTSGTNISCNGATDGEIDAVTINGIAPFTFLWSNNSTSQNLTSVGAGSYYVTVTDSLGSVYISNTITLTEPSALSVQLRISKYYGSNYSISHNGGNDGSIEAYTRGGNTPYNFLFSNDSTTEKIDGLNAGTYSVTVTDNNGCAATASSTLTEPDPVQLSSVTSPTHNGYNLSCGEWDKLNKLDGLIHVSSAGGIPPYFYIVIQDSVNFVYNDLTNGFGGLDTTSSHAQKDFKNLASGNYIIGVIDRSGMSFAIGQITLTKPDTLFSSLTVIDSTNQILSTVSGGLTPYNYSWNSGATTPNLTNPGIGDYKLTVTDANGCRFAIGTTLGDPSKKPWQVNGNWADTSYFLGTYVNQPLIFKTNSGERMRITPNGNVGIGTSTPQAKLDVAGNVNVRDTLKTSNLSITNSFAANKVNTTRIAPVAGDSLVLIGDSSIAFGTYNRIYPDPRTWSNWGSGTIGPTTYHGIAMGNSNSYAMGNNSLALGSNLFTGHLGNNSIVIGSGVSNTSQLGNSTPNSLKIGFNSDIATFFVSPANGVGTTGNVGIGTTNPLANLDVQNTNSAGSVTLNLTHTGQKIFMDPKLAYGDFSGLTQAGDAGIFFTDDNGGLSRNANAGLVIAPWAAPTNTYAGIRIDANGNVGIGTDLTNNVYNNIINYYKLSVNGSIRAKELVVETGWSDFVFERNYKLLSLVELEKYINKYKHLPNIPTAKEINENGLKIAETQTQMMQKIEELTLYIIEQDKKLTELQEKIAAIEKH